MNLNTEKFEKEEVTYCEKCGDKTSMHINLLGKIKIVPTICRCQKEELEYREKLEKKKILDNHINLLITQGIMDKQFLDNTFVNDNRSNPKVFNACKKYVENWDEIKKENIGILLYGDVGRGKTFYASCIANELFKDGVSICITSFPKILDKLMNFTEESRILIEKVKTQSLLVIDDFGVERTTEYTLEQIFKVLDDRLRSKLPTIITTNLNIDTFETPKTLEQKRIYSRILEMCPIRILVDNNDNRQKRADLKKSIAKKILS